jgi:hypothetical protein
MSGKFETTATVAILRVAPPWARPTFEPAQRPVCPNGAARSAARADPRRHVGRRGLRCPQADELLHMLAMVARVAAPMGDATAVTTTLRPIKVLKEIIGSSSTRITRERRPEASPRGFARLSPDFQPPRKASALILPSRGVLPALPSHKATDVHPSASNRQPESSDCALHENRPQSRHLR